MVVAGVFFKRWYGDLEAEVEVPWAPRLCEIALAYDAEHVKARALLGILYHIECIENSFETLSPLSRSPQSQNAKSHPKHQSTKPLQHRINIEPLTPKDVASPPNLNLDV